jgi:hypothetical protein
VRALESVATGDGGTIEPQDGLSGCEIYQIELSNHLDETEHQEDAE